jgi:polyhydroxybutyrate depolymerase
MCPTERRRWADFRSFWPFMAGNAGTGMRRLTHLDRVADARGVIVIYPDGVDRHWNDGRSTIRNPQDDVGFVSALLNRVGRDIRIDNGRIYATGISNGALFAQRLGCDLSQRIAAIAP